jgi:transcription termination/antitermination protein NusA
MSTTPESQEEVRLLFRRHVPEVADGSVEIVSVARAVARRSWVAVRSQSKSVDPVGACTGQRGAHLKAMVGELKGEHLTVIRWDKSAARFIQNAFGGHPSPEVVLDESARTASVTIAQPAPHAPDAGLLGELTGWKIRLQVRGGEGEMGLCDLSARRSSQRMDCQLGTHGGARDCGCH